MSPFRTVRHTCVWPPCVYPGTRSLHQWWCCIECIGKRYENFIWCEKLIWLLLRSFNYLLSCWGLCCAPFNFHPIKISRWTYRMLVNRGQWNVSYVFCFDRFDVLDSSVSNVLYAHSKPVLNSGSTVHSTAPETLAASGSKPEADTGFKFWTRPPTHSSTLDATADRHDTLLKRAMELFPLKQGEWMATFLGLPIHCQQFTRFLSLSVVNMISKTCTSQNETHRAYVYFLKFASPISSWDLQWVEIKERKQVDTQVACQIMGTRMYLIRHADVCAHRSHRGVCT